ncbi:hypothetical protein K3165_05945 [Qipengyuania sp. 1XM1-15A]|uniref:hypothetical protein n=1 Tax=Qipengyuania xiamenensis TaxID=2867237 RepID=UPI001C88798C|nr:hypothetical protein [Qipengyuania xiamenensis]MBX7532459.1 hypothetical protein [Qipengyuania xiamenensis]
MKLFAKPICMFLASVTATMIVGASAAFAGGHAEGRVSIRVSVLSDADAASRSAAKRVNDQRGWAGLCQALSSSDLFKIVTLDGDAVRNAGSSSCDLSRKVDSTEVEHRSKSKPLALMVSPI